MDKVELYSFLFTDSLVATLVLPFQTEIVYPAMRMFGGYDMVLASYVAIMAFVIGMSLNYLFGRVLTAIPIINPDDSNNQRYCRLVFLIRKYGYLLVFLSWIPYLGSMFIVLLGFFGVKFRYLVSLVIVTGILHYFVQI